jgi:hypothetical protein
MTADNLVRDCIFLDKIASRSDDARRGSKKKSHKTKKMKLLTSACSDRGISIRFMPKESSRAKDNRSHVSSDKRDILWTVRWRFYDSLDNLAWDSTIPELHEDVPIFRLLSAIVETAPNDLVAKVTLDTHIVLMTAEGAAGGGVYEIDASLGLRENLFAKNVIEFPFLEVVCRDCIGNWRIVSVLDVREIEKVKEVVVVKKEVELPAYEEIKRALKMDLIQGVIEEARNAEIRNEPLPADAPG